LRLPPGEGAGSVASPGLAQGRLECVCTNHTGCGQPRVGEDTSQGRGEQAHHATTDRVPPPLCATALLTADPAKASGTFNPLCKVLCILQSLYLCAIGPTLVFRLARDTPCTSNCSPKPLYSWMQAAAPQGQRHTPGVQDNIPLLWTIPGRFLVPLPDCDVTPPTPEPTASGETHSSRLHLPRQCETGSNLLRAEPCVDASSIAFTVAIAVAWASSTE